MTVDSVTLKDNSNYHHGNLRQTLLTAATEMIAENGIESLSLRKLADKVGVSRTAAYHYFQDKNDLLCAIAANGFRRWQASLNELKSNLLPERDKFEQYILGYIAFATNNPEEYELMFGRTIWKQANCTVELQQISHAIFQHQVDMIAHTGKLWASSMVTTRFALLRLFGVLYMASPSYLLTASITMLPALKKLL